jgi:uncharacterized protein with PIN domain
VKEARDRFTACTGCGRVYWEGSHWKRMRAIVDASIVAPPLTMAPD